MHGVDLFIGFLQKDLGNIMNVVGGWGKEESLFGEVMWFDEWLVNKGDL